MLIDEQTFKQALAQWASGVTVVTTRSPEGDPKGMTASAFSSVSMDPFLVLVCVAKKLYTHRLIEESGFFAVNILGTDHNYWGKLFAGMFPDVEDRWAEIVIQTAETGAPILPGVPGWVDCRVYQQVESGNHSIFIGEVLAAAGPGNVQPLMYFNRSWGTFTPLAE